MMQVNLLALAVRDFNVLIRRSCDSLRLANPTFQSAPAVTDSFIFALADAIESGQSLMGPIDQEWNQKVLDFAQSCDAVGVFSFHLRCVVSKICEIIIPKLEPADESRHLDMLHVASLLALESVARWTAKAIAKIAFHSESTGLRNKRAFENDLSKAVAAGRLAALLIVYIDMDGLKGINDTQGHAAGDEALKRLGALLSAAAVDGQTPYHFSGDEFGLVNTIGNEQDLRVQLDRMCDDARNKFSYGIASWSADGSELNQVVKVADLRMQEQKADRKAQGKAPPRTPADLLPAIQPSRRQNETIWTRLCRVMGQEKKFEQ